MYQSPFGGGYGGGGYGGGGYGGGTMKYRLSSRQTGLFVVLCIVLIGVLIAVAVNSGKKSPPQVTKIDNDVLVVNQNKNQSKNQSRNQSRNNQS